MGGPLEYLKRFDSVMLGHICLTDYQASEGVGFVQLRQNRRDPDTSVLHVWWDCASLHASRNFMKKYLMLHEVLALRCHFLCVFYLCLYMDVVNSGF
jgi:hypothetical protein